MLLAPIFLHCCKCQPGIFICSFQEDAQLVFHPKTLGNSHQIPVFLISGLVRFVFLQISPSSSSDTSIHGTSFLHKPSVQLGTTDCQKSNGQKWRYFAVAVCVNLCESDRGNQMLYLGLGFCVFLFCWLLICCVFVATLMGLDWKQKPGWQLGTLWSPLI